MEYTDIHRCIQILHEKPKWFFQKNHISDKLQCFEFIQQVGTPATIYSIFEFLRNDNVLLKTKAAETILHLLEKLKTPNDYADTLKHLQIEENDLEYYRVDFDAKTYLQILGIASLNSSGYVREKAVKELARLKNADGLKFILLRLGDWVVEVRNAANEAVLSFLEETYIDGLLRNLPTIEWLLKVKRVDLSQVHAKIIQFILSHDFSGKIFNKITSLDDKTRFRFYKVFLNSRQLDKEQVLRISKDKSFLVRLELLKHFSAFDTDTQKELLARYLHDNSSSVRLEALYASRGFSLFFEKQITNLLSDETASVRRLSRQLLNDTRECDFAAIYRQRIAGKQYLSGSLLGLTETGSSEDLAIFEQHIKAGEGKIIVVCLKAINKFNGGLAKQYSLGLLVHEISKVRDKSIEILAKNCDMTTLMAVREIYAQSNLIIKKTILKLFSKIGGWNIVGDLLLALSDEDTGIQNFGWQLLERWRAKATNLFTTAPPLEMERTNRIFTSLDAHGQELTGSRAKLLREVKFILR